MSWQRPNRSRTNVTTWAVTILCYLRETSFPSGRSFSAAARVARIGAVVALSHSMVVEPVEVKPSSPVRGMPSEQRPGRGEFWNLHRLTGSWVQLHSERRVSNEVAWRERDNLLAALGDWWWGAVLNIRHDGRQWHGHERLPVLPPGIRRAARMALKALDDARFARRLEAAAERDRSQVEGERSKIYRESAPRLDDGGRILADGDRLRGISMTSIPRTNRLESTESTEAKRTTASAEGASHQQRPVWREPEHYYDAQTIASEMDQWRIDATRSARRAGDLEGWQDARRWAETQWKRLVAGFTKVMRIRAVSAESLRTGIVNLDDPRWMGEPNPNPSKRRRRKRSFPLAMGDWNWRTR